MSFFKKRRFDEVEGYERISRLIDERQRELGEGEHSADDFDEDTVVLAPQSRAAQHAQREPVLSAQADTISLRRPLEAPSHQAEPATRPEQPQSFAPPSPHFSQPSVPSVGLPSLPRMQAPELPAIAGNVTSLVAKDAVWTGKLTSTGDVRVEGRLEGEVQTSGTLLVAAGARVQGNSVRARNVILAGEIEGQLHCEERLEILPGGSARGEIDTGALVVHEGAFIESKFQMHRDGAA